MDVEKFVSDMNTGEELGRQVDRGLSRIDTMLTMIENRMAYGDWLADDKSGSGLLIGDEVVPVVLAPGWWDRLVPERVNGAGLISADEFR